MKKVVNNKCFIYARKAVKEQGQSDEDAVVDQIQILQKLAKDKKFTITRSFIEVGSSRNNERKELTSMLNLLKTGDTKIVLCTNVDRITRDFQSMLLIDKALNDSNAVLMTPDYTYGDNYHDDFIWDVQVMLASAYRKMQSQITKEGIARAKAKKAILLARVSTEKQAYEPSK